ncbi:MFS transporter [Amnibacterium sp.]|uniref:MFS transporter n=1 Tax=Amnibacterium sp. TaxID=1872496 RepID=UPI003F7BA177
MRRLLADRDVRLVVGGQTVSAFGDAALWLVAAVWVQRLTDSVALAGLTFFFLTLPAVFAPLAGLLVDRVPRRPLLVIGNLVSGVLVLLLLLVRGAGDVWLIWLVMTGYGCSAVLLGAGASALLPDVVPAAQLGPVNALIRSLREALRVVAPAFGTALFAMAGGGAVAVVDAVTFLVAAGALGLLRIVESPRETEEHPHLLRSIAAGFRHLAGIEVLRRTTTALGLILLVVGFLESAGFALIVDGLHRPAAFVGVTQLAQGVGAIIGGVTAVRVLPRTGESALAALGGIGIGAGCAVWALPPSPVSVFGGAALIGAGLPWLAIGAETLVQLRTPGPLLGRAFGAVEVATSVPQTVSIATGAALLTVVPYGWVILVVAVVCAATGLWLLIGRAGPSAEPA